MRQLRRRCSHNPFRLSTAAALAHRADSKKRRGYTPHPRSVPSSSLGPHCLACGADLPTPPKPRTGNRPAQPALRQLSRRGQETRAERQETRAERQETRAERELGTAPPRNGAPSPTMKYSLRPRPFYSITSWPPDGTRNGGVPARGVFPGTASAISRVSQVVGTTRLSPCPRPPGGPPDRLPAVAGCAILNSLESRRSSR